VKVGVGVGVGTAEGVGVGVETFVGAALTTTPLFHTNFFPCFMQVNLRPFRILSSPGFLHVAPDFTAAALCGATITPTTSAATNKLTTCLNFIPKR
jgi:hypothetical protein